MTALTERPPAIHSSLCQKSNWMMVAVGLLAPLLVVAFTAGFGYNQYPDFNVGK